MKTVSKLMGLVTLLLPIGAAFGAPNYSATVAIFNGKIDHKTVDEFMRTYGRRADLTEFSVASEGGEVLAAIRLARWIKSKNLNVRVRTMCYSGCANYLFLAGNNKIIEPGAFVAWHGDAEQKDFRELVAKYAKLLGKRNGGAKLKRSEVLFLNEYKLSYIGLSKAQREQGDFYRTVAVNPVMGRMGQEPILYPSDGWTFTVRAMSLLGIKNVSAPRNYGDETYFRDSAPLAALANEGPLLVFDTLDGINIIPVRPH